MLPDNTDPINDDDRAFIRRWVESGIPPLMIELAREKRLIDAGLLTRLGLHIRLTDQAHLLFGSRTTE